MDIYLGSILYKQASWPIEHLGVVLTRSNSTNGYGKVAVGESASFFLALNVRSVKHQEPTEEEKYVPPFIFLCSMQW